MLRIFLSSTFRDLKGIREEILSGLNESLLDVGMENFVPDGRTSHEIAIDELKKSDIVLFMISPYYGSIIEKCKLDNCRESCKIGGDNAISYTHCEYKTAALNNKPHQAYIVNNGWDIIDELKNWEKIDWEKVKNNPIFRDISVDEIKHYFKISKKAAEFREQARIELAPTISDAKAKNAIISQLGSMIPGWYSHGAIKFKDFCGRQKELSELIQKMDDGVEVFGVGGIGKTTLIHVALLIQKLKGYKIIAIGKNQPYFTGSGYKYFLEKCKREQHEIFRDVITIDDVIDALPIVEDLRLVDLPHIPQVAL
jgi:hypothetical protein